MYSKVIKPFFDIFLSLILLLLLSPIILLLVILLFLFQKGNVFFKQDRPGYKEKIFKVYKFKTMTDDRDEVGNLLPDEKRLTWIGKVVRKTSLDEIPQIINVVQGQMSFVGPRPWLVEYLPLYSEEQRKRHEVKPGITGWAQVNGRNQLSWADRFQYDIYYVENQSFWLDLKILIKTLLKVFKAEGVSNKGHVTMEKYKGE